MRKFRLYKAPSGDVVVNVIIEEESVWLTQKSMGIVFDTTPQNITIHLRNIFESGELEELSTCKEILQVQKEGGRQVSRKQKFYNLDAIISVGYRVNSAKATQFRIWATKTLKEYLIKGFVLDDNRLKEGEILFGKDYFKELLERVRSIRASERRIYQQITDIFAECSIDYNPESVHIENLIERENTFTMEGLAKSVDKFLNFNEYKILDGKGKISHSQATSKAVNEYGEFNKTQKIISDFDKQIRRLKE